MDRNSSAKDGGSDDTATQTRWIKAAAAVALLGIAAAAAASAGIRSRRFMDARNRVAFITGGSRGLGLILARKLAAAGARVALLARDAGGLERARVAILQTTGAAPEHVLVLAADITDREQLESAIREAAERLGPIDILINNAGVIEVGPMDTMTEADYKEALAVHFWAPYFAAQAVLPSMRARETGRIVNIASIGGKVSVPHLLPYSTSKFALVGFSEGLRSELLSEGVYVTTVCPGLIRTGSPRNASFKGQHEKEYTWFALSDSLPGVSMSADRAADQILDAMRYGDAEIVTSLPAQAIAALHGVFPGFVTDALGVVNRFLPDAGEAGPEKHRGSESETPLTRSALTALTRKAESRNNQGPA